MNYCRTDFGVGILNGKIYVVGGIVDQPVNSVECYDPNSDTWMMVNFTNFTFLIEFHQK